jgi:diacylglycerol kinase (ATP)
MVAATDNLSVSPLFMAQPHICFILHGRRCPPHLPNRLFEQFSPAFEISIHITSSAVGAEDAACLAIEQGCNYLIAVGGDGTVHEVVNGVMRVDEARRGRVTLGILPYGTGNDFARTLGMTGSIAGLHRLIGERRVRRLDLGRLRQCNDDGTVRTTYFANIASLGISATVVDRVAALPRWFPSALAYAVGIVWALLRWRPLRMRFAFDDGRTYEETLLNVCLANGRYFGGGLGVAPDARADDGQLDLVMIRRASVGAFLRFLPSLRRGRRIDDDRVVYARCRASTIDTLPPGCPLEADGEHVGCAPVTIDLLPAALAWLCAKADMPAGDERHSSGNTAENKGQDAGELSAGPVPPTPDRPE